MISIYVYEKKSCFVEINILGFSGKNACVNLQLLAIEIKPLTFLISGHKAISNFVEKSIQKDIHRKSYCS